MPRNQKIVLRQGTTTPGAPNFEVGEPAWDKLAKKLYIKAEDGTMVEIAGGGGGGGGTGNSFTASETPPEAPLDGDLWLDKSSGILYLYSPDGDSSQWVEHSAPVAAPVFLASTIPPTSPNAGDEWLNLTTGVQYRYITTASGSQWVETSAGGGTTSSGGASLDVDPAIAGMIF